MKYDLKGIYPALIVPFTTYDTVDEVVLRNLIDSLIEEGIHGFYVGGSTGESLLMSMDERKHVLEIVMDQVDKRVKVLAHIGCFHTQDAIQLAAHAREVGVEALSSLPPFYYKFTIEELTDYYLSITEAVDLPMIIYNAPALTGISFDLNNTSELFKNINMAGIKFTSYDLFLMQRMMEKYPDKIIINGHDEIFLSSLAIGCRCAIGSTFNFMAPLFIDIKKSFLSGDMHYAAELQGQANKVIEVLVKTGVFRGVKGMLELKGIPCGSCREPFIPLKEDERALLSSVFPVIYKRPNKSDEFPQYWRQ